MSKNATQVTSLPGQEASEGANAGKWLRESASVFLGAGRKGRISGGVKESDVA
jgi:hypothetical protein